MVTGTCENLLSALRRAQPRVQIRLLSWFLLALLSLGEYRVFERLLFSDPVQYGFVLSNVTGILVGRPVSKSWQHRLLGPLIVSSLKSVSNSQLDADKMFYGLTLLVSNFLLFALTRRKYEKRAAVQDAAEIQRSWTLMRPWIGGAIATAAFGFAHFLFVYRLEYPWDAIDVLIFLVFGYVVWCGRPSWWLAPLLLAGTFNHETVLYIPLWYIIDALHPKRSRAKRRRDLSIALSTLLPILASILLLRQWMYVGRPNLPSQVFEKLTPVISNHWHLTHNVRHLLIENWTSEQVFISLVLLATITLLLRMARTQQYRTASLWSLSVITTIFCFGYINETRHYLGLMAFWIMYGTGQRQHSVEAPTGTVPLPNPPDTLLASTGFDSPQC